MSLDSMQTEWGIRKTITTVVTVLGVLILLIAGFKVTENNAANEIMVVQAPVSGKFSFYTTPGLKWQGFGTVTTYPLRHVYPMAYQVRFNDGGHGILYGSIQWEMPLTDSLLKVLHTRFHSTEAIQANLIQTVTNKSMYMTGPMMSSKESYAERRNELIRLVEDQITGGIYRTSTKEEKQKDPITGADKSVRVTEIVRGADGIPQRQENAVLAEFGLRTFNFTIDSLIYDKSVEDQIQGQQQLAMQVQTAIAQAREAEQKAITVAKQGEAAAATAKWEQEVIKAKEVTSAEQRKEVARLDADAAEFRKLANIRDGEGEARKRELIMSADGALALKLATYEKVNQMYATAIGAYTGNWVPSVVWGGGSSATAGSGAMGLVDLVSAKTALDLGLDMSARREKPIRP
jgi:hypothetical protein